MLRSLGNPSVRRDYIGGTRVRLHNEVALVEQPYGRAGVRGLPKLLDQMMSLTIRPDFESRERVWILRRNADTNRAAAIYAFDEGARYALSRNKSLHEIRTQNLGKWIVRNTNEVLLIRTIAKLHEIELISLRLHSNGRLAINENTIDGVSAYANWLEVQGVEEEVQRAAVPNGKIIPLKRLS